MFRDCGIFWVSSLDEWGSGCTLFAQACLSECLGHYCCCFVCFFYSQRISLYMNFLTLSAEHERIIVYVARVMAVDVCPMENVSCLSTLAFH